MRHQLQGFSWVTGLRESPELEEDDCELRWNPSNQEIPQTGRGGWWGCRVYVVSVTVGLSLFAFPDLCGDLAGDRFPGAWRKVQKSCLGH